jgi:hypothetical protein
MKERLEFAASFWWKGKWRVAAAGKDRKAGIFGEAGVGFGEFAEEKLGAAVGLDFAGVLAVGAKANGGGTRLSRGTHGCSIRERELRVAAKSETRKA